MVEEQGELEQAAVGSSDWYKQFCAQYDLHPFDAHKDHDSAEDLKKQCDEALRELASFLKRGTTGK